MIIRTEHLYSDTLLETLNFSPELDSTAQFKPCTVRNHSSRRLDNINARENVPSTSYHSGRFWLSSLETFHTYTVMRLARLELLTNSSILNQVNSFVTSIQVFPLSLVRRHFWTNPYLGYLIFAAPNRYRLLCSFVANIHSRLRVCCPLFGSSQHGEEPMCAFSRWSHCGGKVYSSDDIRPAGMTASTSTTSTIHHHLHPDLHHLPE